MYLNSNEKYIKTLLKNSGRKETQKIQVAYAAQMFILTLFSMFALGISNITNESVSNNDLQQMTAILSSIILVSIITIVFFQWILSMQIRAIFNVRKRFNNSLLLMGTPKWKIIKIYFYEWLSMHILSLIMGIIAAEILYIIISTRLSLSETIIPLKIIFFSIVSDTAINCVFFIVQINSDISKNVIARIQNKNLVSVDQFNRWNVKKIICNLILVAAFSIFTYIIGNIFKIRQIKELLKIGYIISILLLYNCIVPLFHKAITIICKKRGYFNLLIANKTAQGVFRQIKVTCMFFILSSTLFIGLHTMFSKVREAGEDVAYYHIQYDNMQIYSKVKEYTTGSTKNIFYGIEYKGKTERGSNVWIKGITSEYAEQYEDYEIVTGYEDKFVDLCEVSEGNSIFLPELYASESDVGKVITIIINGKQFDFIIAGLYFSNDFSKLTCLANLDYLKSVFEMDSNEYNSVYNKVKPLDVAHSDYYSTKQNIESNSKEKAVSGTELVEVITYILLCCAIFSLLIYYSLVSGESKMNVVRYRSMGMPSFKIVKIYLYNALFPVVISFIFVIPIVHIFTNICCYTMLDPYYFQNVEYSGNKVMMVVGVIFTLISIVAQIFNIFKYISKKDYIGILKDSMY